MFDFTVSIHNNPLLPKWLKEGDSLGFGVLTGSATSMEDAVVSRSFVEANVVRVVFKVLESCVVD